MKTVIKHELKNATGSTYKNYRDRIELTLTEIVGLDETKVQTDMSHNDALSLFKSLKNSLIEAKVIRGKKSY
jgi:hypothetical protein